MPRFEIRPTNHDTLDFEGELLVEATSPKHETEDGQRGYALALYSKSSGGFVASIEYQTTCPYEHSVVQAEVVDEPEDVESFLLLFAPCEHVDQKALRVLPNEQRRKLKKVMCRRYEDQVNQLLDALTEHFGDWHDETASDRDRSEPAPKRGFLSFLGLK